MNSVSLSLESITTKQLLISTIKQSENFFDIVAACYHTIMQYYGTNEKNFIAKVDNLMDNSLLVCFRQNVNSLIYCTRPGSDAPLDFSDFLNTLCSSLENMVYPDDIDNEAYTSIISYCIIDSIDDNLQSESRERIYFFPDHCPLNTSVFKNECSVYFREIESILEECYEHNGFRKPLCDYTIGTSFKYILMFENTELKSPVPKIKPVFISKSCKDQVKNNHFLRIASIPFIGYDTFNIFEKKDDHLVNVGETPKGEFYIGYRKENEAEDIRKVIRLLSLAIQNEANIIIFPEFIMSTAMLSAIKKYLDEHSNDNINSKLLLVMAGTNYEYNNGQGNNILYIYDSLGEELGCYYKFSPFLTLCDDQIHGVHYDEDKPTSSATELKSKKRFINLEILSNPGKECTLFDIESIGRILPAICRDVIDGVYTETLAKIFMPSFILISAWSPSISSFSNRLSTLANTIHTSSLLCNCCNAVKSDKKDIGLFIYPQKKESKMKAEEYLFKRQEGCQKTCDNLGGCIHLVDLHFDNGKLSVIFKQLNGCVKKGDNYE